MIKTAQGNKVTDRSGSCALIAIIIGFLLVTQDDNCFIANVGDSRALLISDSGKKVISLSQDHKPQLPIE